MSSKKIAICFWGSFSQEDSSYKDKLSNSNLNLSFAVQACVQTLLKALPTNADFYVHSWTNWIKDSPLIFEKAKIEDNQMVMTNALKYIDLKVEKESFRGILTSEKHNIHFWNKQSLANQMSSAVSKSRVLKLIEKKIDLYEGIVLIRPDLFAFNQTIDLNFKEGIISCNSSPSTIYGDFIFSLKPSEIFLFHEYAEIESNTPLYYLAHYGFAQFLRKYNLSLSSTSEIAGRDIEVYRKISIPMILHNRKIPKDLNGDLRNYLIQLAFKEKIKNDMNFIKEVHTKNNVKVFDTREKLIDALKLNFDFYILGSKIPLFDEIIKSFNAKDFLLILPNLLLAQISNNSSKSEIEKSIDYLFKNHDEVIQMSKDNPVTARSFLLVNIWINHFKFKEFKIPIQQETILKIFYQLRDIFINFEDSINCQLVELFLETEYGYDDPILYSYHIKDLK